MCQFFPNKLVLYVRAIDINRNSLYKKVEWYS